MFIQVITGHVADRSGIEEALDRWERELRPEAIGFLGSTAGVTEDDRFVVLARFQSAEAARANSNRPEQGEWWNEAEKCFHSPPTFRDCTEVDTYLGGGSDHAGFVQVMQGRGDRDRLRALDDRVGMRLSEVRPDLLGSVRAWHGDEFTEAAYFVSEAAARAGEAMKLPPDLEAAWQEWQDAAGEITYYDLTSPRLVS
jgi:hypothetical protein